MAELAKSVKAIEEAYLKKLAEISKNINDFYEIEREMEEPSQAMLNAILDENVELFEFLMNNGLFRSNLYPLLLKADSSLGLSYLLDRYIGSEVNYDHGITGYAGTLKGFFSEVVELHGADYLRGFLHSDRVDKKKLLDGRLKEAIFFAVPELDSMSEVDTWLNRSES